MALAGLLQACDWHLADLARIGNLLTSSTDALDGRELDCIDWAELAGDCSLPNLSAICIEQLIADNKVSYTVWHRAILAHASYDEIPQICGFYDSR